MAKVRILPEILSNQIAAGEVVQRPASVVKELVENSIDAGAASITIEIEKGGASLIRVSDDGSGMSRDDALLAIERYATSKIRQTSDLFAISTMGFRGEALPSIASVSKFTLVTRTQHSNVATKIEIAGGKIRNVSDAGAPAGTMVEVRHLFYNTPARRKFLKSENTELGHIADIVLAIALGNPEIGLRFFVNTRLVKHFPCGQSLFQRAVAVLGKDVINNLYEFESLAQDISVTGVCSNPSVTRTSSGRLYFFVNNRVVYDRGLVAAVFRGYDGRVMKGRFPVGAVMIEIPFDRVDVNVHPCKREIKLFDPGPVYQLITRAVSSAILKAQENITSYSRISVPEFHEPESQDSPKARFNWEVSLDESCDVVLPVCEPCDSRPASQQGHGSRYFSASHKESVQEPGSGFNILGQIMGTYIVAEKDTSLVLVDQHAAHERIVYEKLKKRHEKAGVQSQSLLVPETLELGHRDADILAGILSGLSELGFKIEPFGGTCFLIRAVPGLVETKNIKELVTDLMELASEACAPSLPKHKWLDACLISMACHSAVRANHKLHHAEMVKLLEDLEKCDNPMHCPHGRPTMISFDKNDMEKLFKRVV